MDQFRKFDTYGFNILDDPVLRTSVNDFPFQFIPTEQFEQIIKSVQKDRIKQKKNAVWKDICRPLVPPNGAERPVKSNRKSNRSHGKRIIKTPTSTVKILTHPMVEKQSDDEEPRKPINEQFVVPKVRIMTDAEIQKVVENAVLEVIQQQLKKSQEILEKNELEESTEINLNFECGDSPRIECLNSVRQVTISSARYTARSENKSESSLKNENEAELFQAQPEIQDNNVENMQIELTDDENKLSPLETAKEKRVNDTSKQEVDSPRWVPTNYADNRKSNEELSANIEDLENDKMLNVSLEESFEIPITDQTIPPNTPEVLSPEHHKADEVNKISEEADIHTTDKEEIEKVINPALSSLERDEFRKLLGIQGIMAPEMDLHRFEEKETTDESEDMHEELTKIFPVIHIRHPTPREWIMESDVEEIFSEVENEAKIEESNQREVFVDGKTIRPYPVTLKKPPSRKELSTSKSREYTEGTIHQPRIKSKSSKNTAKVNNISTQDTARAQKILQQFPAKAPNTSRQESARLRSPAVRPKKNQTSAQLIPTTKPPKLAISPMTARKAKNLPSQSCLKSSRSFKPQEEMTVARLNQISEEKMQIFSKITSCQERIIDLLDQLRMSLLNLSLPDGQPERKVREKHVIEFSARFGRNYLYQLERLITEIRTIPKEQYLSTTSNDTRTKVCVIYGILQQAVQSYLKQMKYFLLDQSPRKLDVLIGYIMEATKICIHKKVFDKRDNLISCLILRCQGILTFLEEVEEQSVKTHRRKKKSDGIDQNAPSKWDMMQPKKLSMYDAGGTAPPKRKPSLPKANQGKKKAIRQKEKKVSKSNISEVKVSSNIEVKVENLEKLERESSSAIVKTKESLCSRSSQVRHDFEVNTQMESMPKESMTLLTPASHRSSSSSNDDGKTFPYVVSTRKQLELNKSNKAEEEVDLNVKNQVFEALHTITKQQVNNILGSLVSNLGFALNEKTTTLDLETLLSGLNSVTTQMVNVPATERDTFNQKGMHSGCFNNERLGEHTVSNEHQLDLSQRKQRAQALLNRQMNPLPGEDDDVANTSLRETVEFPETNILELPTIEEERRSCSQEIRRSLHSECGDGANLPCVQNAKGKKVQQLRYDRNIQFMFVSGDDTEDLESANQIRNCVNLELNLPLDESDQDFYDVENDNAVPENPQEPANTEEPKWNINSILEERLNFIKQIAENPLYVNNFFGQPWKVVTRLTDKIVEELTDAVEKDVSFGEETYLEDFLKFELNL